MFLVEKTKLMEEDWITTAEASRLTGYNNEHVRRLVRSGKVKARKFGIVWQVDRKSLMDYFKSEGRGPKSKHRK